MEKKPNLCNILQFSTQEKKEPRTSLVFDQGELNLE
jgi:hypothetical protein